MAIADKNELPHVTTALESIAICHNGTLLGSLIDPVVNAMSNRQPPRSSALARIAKGSKGTLAPTY
jgi:hypothetical protein